jgi:hypothetical protein
VGGPAAALLGRKFDLNSPALYPLGDGRSVAIVPEGHFRSGVVVRLTGDPRGDDPLTLCVRLLAPGGRFGLRHREPIVDAHGTLHLPGHRGKRRSEAEGGGMTQVFYVLQLHADGTTQIVDTPGELVMIDREGRRYFTKLRGRGLDWFGVVDGEGPPAYFRIPHTSDRMSFAQAGDGRVWIRHHDRFTAVTPPQTAEAEWVVGPTVRIGGVPGRLDLVDWSEQGFFVLRFNSFDWGQLHADDETPPAVAIFRPPLRP